MSGGSLLNSGPHPLDQMLMLFAPKLYFNQLVAQINQNWVNQFTYLLFHRIPVFHKNIRRI